MAVVRSFMKKMPEPDTPQPGDGRYLVQLEASSASTFDYKPRRRPRRKPKTLARNGQDEVKGETQASAKPPRPCLQNTNYDFGKARTSSHQPPEQTRPRTIAAEKLLSPPPLSHPNISTFRQEPLDFECDPYKDHTDIHSEIAEYSQTSSDAMASRALKGLPPHLRPKSTVTKSDKTKSTEEAASSALKANEESKTSVETPPNATDITDIKEKLSQHGVTVSDSKPVPKSTLVDYASSSDAGDVVFKPNTKAHPPFAANGKRSTGTSGSNHHGFSQRGGRSRGRGAGPMPRDSRWPKKTDFPKPDPKRWDVSWDDKPANKSSCSSIDSLCADSGFGDSKKKKKNVPPGIDEDTGFLLTDWDGNWAPAPVDWDARPAFRDNQSAELIERWMDRIEEEMVGKVWGVSMKDVTRDGVTFYFAPDPKDKELSIQGDIAPRYWIPVVIGRQAPQTFWKELVESKAPEPFDDGDLDGTRPWWELYAVPGSECTFLKHYEEPEMRGIDPDENLNERLARENDHGANQHTENRKRLEKAKRDAQRERRLKAQAKARKISESTPAAERPDKITPGLNLYLRSARPADVRRLREIYNHYVEFTICTPETQRRTDADITQRLRGINLNKLPFLVACERGGKVRLRNIVCFHPLLTPGYRSRIVGGESMMKKTSSCLTQSWASPQQTITTICRACT